jgi:hypothetical protein
MKSLDLALWAGFAVFSILLFFYFPAQAVEKQCFDQGLPTSKISVDQIVGEAIVLLDKEQASLLSIKKLEKYH